MSSLWKFPNAYIFHEPVDPEKLGIPDYFEVITNPIDFGTIKIKLAENMYDSMESFLADIQLTFDNCIKFNGEESHVTKLCKNVREEYKRLYDQLNIQFYLSWSN